MNNYNYPNYGNNPNNNSLLSQAQKDAIDAFVANPTEETWQAVIGIEPFDDEILRFAIIPELFRYEDLRGFKYVMEHNTIDPLDAGTRVADADGDNWWWDVTNLFDLACEYNDEDTFNYLLDLLESRGINIWQFYTPGRGAEIGDGYISECNNYLKNRRKDELQKLMLLRDKIPGLVVRHEIAAYTPLFLTENEKNEVEGIIRPPPPPRQAPPMPPPEEEYYAELREPFLHRIQVPNANKRIPLRKKRIISELDITIRYNEDHPRPDYEARINVTLQGKPSHGDYARVNRIVYKNDKNILIGLDYEIAQIYEYNGRVYYKGPYGPDNTHVFPRFVTIEDIWSSIEPHLNMGTKTSVSMWGGTYDKYYFKVFGTELKDDYTITVFDLKPVMNYITASEGLKHLKMNPNTIYHTVIGSPNKKVPLTTLKGINRYRNITRRKETSKQKRMMQAAEQRKKAKEAQVIAKVKAYEKKKYTRRRK